MPFFIIPYQSYSEGTMAHGSHPYVMNFRLRCTLREALYLEPE